MRFSLRQLLIFATLVACAIALSLWWPRRGERQEPKAVIYMLRSSATGREVIEATFYHPDGSTTRILDHLPFDSVDSVVCTEMENRDFDRKRAGGAFAVAWNRLLNQAKLEGLLQRKPVDLSKGEQLQGQGVVFPLTESEIQLLTAAQSQAKEAMP